MLAPAPNHRSNILTIGNSLPSIDANISSSSNDQPDALHPLELDLAIGDSDGDLVTTSIIWFRDGFRVGALDNDNTNTMALCGSNLVRYRECR